jgi:hypothetical protein
MKWIAVILLLVIAVLAAYVAVEYLTVSIHALPSWIPGHKTIPGHPRRPRGHYQKRGILCAIISFIALVGAGFIAFRTSRRRPAQPAPAV